MREYVVLLAVMLTVQTNSLAQVTNEGAETNLLDIIRKGVPSGPIELTPEQDAQLVKEGVLPPLGSATNRHVKAQATNQEPSCVQIELRLVNCPVQQVLDFYSELTGKRVLCDDLAPTVTIRPKKSLPKREAILLIETELSAAGFTLTPVDDKTVRAEWKPAPRKE